MRVTSGNLLLLAVLGGLIAVDVSMRPPSLVATVEEVLLPGLLPGRVARVTLEGPGGVGRVELRREGGQWVVGQRFDFPAQAYAVEELLAGLSRLTTGTLAASEAASHERLGVGSDGLSVRLSDADGASLADLVLGAPEADGTSPVVHVRSAAAVAVLRAAELALPPLDPAAWLETRLSDLDPSRVRGVEARWTDADGQPRSLSVARTDGVWSRSDMAGGAPLPSAPIRALLDTAALLHLRDVLGADDSDPVYRLGPDAASLSLAVTDLGGATTLLRLGAPLAPDAVHATTSAFDRPFTVALPADSASLLRDALGAALAAAE